MSDTIIDGQDRAVRFVDLEDEIGMLTSRLQPGERIKLGRRLATALRKANAKRIRQNVDPDGAAFAPRKTSVRERLKKDRKKGLMFRKAAGAAYLKQNVQQDGFNVGFAGNVGRIMRVHDEGLVDAVSHEPGAKRVKYAMRRVLGIATADREEQIDTVIDHLARD